MDAFYFLKCEVRIGDAFPKPILVFMSSHHEHVDIVSRKVQHSICILIVLKVDPKTQIKFTTQNVRTHK